ncbi:inositol 1,4,5-trisphosphate receptor-interacting protein-like 1 [Phasianus colchicus]|uniref:inositol 1,4,5-trisphosphate receptor-interacting protein-like 1 n=1 Tax=Phasianus colchicus TaxID=9054 RepID=UPI00129DDFEB|nr:inositol 1,4,5-trisphosphate receptor-interacting protein-like 1 [Phasianus colchicus]
MAQVIFTALALLGIFQIPELELLHVDVHEHNMQQLFLATARLLHSMEQGSQEQSWAAEEALHCAALPLCVLAGLLVGTLILLAGFCLGKREGKPERKKSESSSSEEEDSEAEEDSDSDEMYKLGRVWARSNQWPTSYMVAKCQIVEELVDNLLWACQGLSCHGFTPRLQQAIGVSWIYEGWSNPRENLLYRLLVPMRPPPGHTFHPETDDTEKMSARKFCLRVELECTCVREQLLGDMLCFLHHTRDELRRNQEPSLLDSFCRGSYLHREKTTRWFQRQVQAAWWHLPQSYDCCLRVLPSLSSCKIKLTIPSVDTFSIEMMLGVQLNSDTFLSFK